VSDPTAASNETATAVQSALDAAHQEREALAQRLEEVDQLIANLQQAADGGPGAPTRQQRQRTARSGRKRSTKKAAGKQGQRKQTTKTSKKTTTAGTQARRKTTGGARRGRPPAGEVGRTDRMVKLIAEADQPLSTGEVRSRLQQYEPEVTSKLVSASLSYAQRKGRIQRSADGRWAAASGAVGTA
jgi:hypothetical protein